jgi:hypothetical protein
MYNKVYKNDFIREFRSSTYSDNFSRGALDALFDYFQDVESDQGEEFELDVTAIACEWSELTLSEALNSYGLDSLDELRDQTHVILISGDESEPEDCKILMMNC